MKLTFRTVAIATATAAVAALFSPGWSKQDGVSLSIGKAEALTRVYVRGYGYRGGYTRNDVGPTTGVAPGVALATPTPVGLITPSSTASAASPAR
jgi:hypothetical protein